MARLWVIRIECELSPQGYDCIIPIDQGERSKDELYVNLRYDVNSNFSSYLDDNPSEEGLQFRNTTVEVVPLSNLRSGPAVVDRRNRDFFTDLHVPLDIVAEIRNKVERRATSGMNNCLKADMNVLLFNANISIRATSYLVDEEQLNDDIARVVTSSREGANKRVCIPAARFAVDSLEKDTYKSAHEIEIIKCMVCLEELEEGQEVILMPCDHVYHENCIVKWLRVSNLCPLCRFAMPVEWTDEILLRR